MKRIWALGCIVAFALARGAWAADAQESAQSWKQQANDTRAAVVAVATELGEIGDQGNAAARGLIEDAKRWLARGDDTLAKADAKLAGEDHQGASQDYNMAWQYYVKAATAGLNAKRILTGE